MNYELGGKGSSSFDVTDQVYEKLSSNSAAATVPFKPWKHPDAPTTFMESKNPCTAIVPSLSVKVIVQYVFSIFCKNTQRPAPTPVIPLPGMVISWQMT